MSHDPSTIACADYFLANYCATHGQALAGANYERHIQALADKIQETVEDYLSTLDQPREPTDH